MVPTPPRRNLAGRALIVFWVVLICGAVAGAAWLQHLGPPRPKPERVAARDPRSVPATPPPLAPDVAAPDPALLAPAATFPGSSLPRVAADGRMAMQVYARHQTESDANRPRIALLYAGIGVNPVDAQVAIDSLPGPVSIAFSPYLDRLPELTADARARGHEMFLSIPMEPRGYPINEEGYRSLLVGAPEAANARNLDWSLSRFDGYVGATGALDGLRGERFLESDGFAPVQDTLARRGLCWIDPRVGSVVTHPPGRSVDMVIDEPFTPIELDGRLARLESLARMHGAALALLVAIRPNAMDHLQPWLATLAARGFDLVPVSMLIRGTP